MEEKDGIIMSTARRTRILRKLRHRQATRKDDGEWIKHTPWHWSRMIHGERLDFWPSSGNYRHGGQMHSDDVYSFIKTHENNVRGIFE